MKNTDLTKKINAKMDELRTELNKIERGGCLKSLQIKLEEIKTKISGIIALTGDEHLNNDEKG